MSDMDFLAQGKLVGADFSERTLEMRVEGDMPTVKPGRYCMVEAERFRMVVMQAKLWREGQKAKA